MDRSIDDTSFADGYGDEPEESGSALEQLDIQHYLRILRKYKFPITLFTAAVTALGAYYAYTATPIYSACLLYTSPSPRDGLLSRMPSSA